MTRRAALLCWVCIGLLCACKRPNDGDGAESSLAVSAATHPAQNGEDLQIGLFSGALPCASCAGIESNIWFDADHTYRRTQRYIGGDSVHSDSSDFGRWSVTLGGRLDLRSTDFAVTRFQIASRTEIRLLDRMGNPTDSQLSHSQEAPGGEFSDSASVAMSGMYTYFADAAIFKPCNMRRTIPVAMTEHHIDLEDAYLHARSSPGAPLKVRIRARLEDRPVMEGDRMAKAVVVSKVLEVLPGQACAVHASLTDSLGWRLSEIDGIPVARPRPELVPRLVFAADRVSGSTGCNRLTGSVQTSGDSLQFGPLAVTRRACTDSLEPKFLHVLGKVDAFRIIENELDLVSEGRLAAVLERSSP